MRALVVVAWLTGCSAVPPWEGCTSGEFCGALAGAAMVVSAVGAPYGAAEKRMRANQISGTCEVELPKAKDACGTILLTITDPRGRVRKAWIQDREFDVRNLPAGPFRILAQSEKLGVSASLEDVKLGQKILIQLRVATPK